jgi:cytoskeletal protein CcmA (bactofilin family)
MLTLFRKLIPGKAEGAPDENFFISAGLQFYGDLVAKASSGRIEGKFDGQIIECKKLIIGANATIKGNIFAHDILVYGYCEGNIYASGDIKVSSLEIFTPPHCLWIETRHSGAIFVS